MRPITGNLCRAFSNSRRNARHSCGERVDSHRQDSAALARGALRSGIACCPGRREKASLYPYRIANTVRRHRPCRQALLHVRRERSAVRLCRNLARGDRAGARSALTARFARFGRVPSHVRHADALCGKCVKLRCAVRLQRNSSLSQKEKRPTPLSSLGLKRIDWTYLGTGWNRPSRFFPTRRNLLKTLMVLTIAPASPAHTRTRPR